jgi:hypothetical protein
MWVQFRMPPGTRTFLPEEESRFAEALKERNQPSRFSHVRPARGHHRPCGADTPVRLYPHRACGCLHKIGVNSNWVIPNGARRRAPQAVARSRGTPNTLRNPRLRKEFPSAADREGHDFSRADTNPHRKPGFSRCGSLSNPRTRMTRKSRTNLPKIARWADEITVSGESQLRTDRARRGVASHCFTLKNLNKNSGSVIDPLRLMLVSVTQSTSL